MTLLTAGGSFAKAYLDQFDGEIASSRKLDDSALTAKLREAETVIHNAASLECSSLEEYIERNFDFTRRLVKLLSRVNPDVHLIYLSSMSILNPEDDKAYGDVLTMLPYSYSKYLAETYCLRSDLTHVSCVRFATLFYKDPKKDGLSKLVNDAVKSGKITLFNGGGARRNFLPLRVGAQYVEKIAGRGGSGKDVFNLAAPGSASFKDVADMLKELVPGLNVENADAPAGNPVLSQFSSESIDKLGRIDFSLLDEIAAYVRELKP